MSKDALIGYTGAASVSIPFVGKSTAGTSNGPSKETIRMAGVSWPGKKGK